jgi:lambda repressor-like predicted transcriptional regulator
MWRREDIIERLKKQQGDRSIRDYAAEIGCSAATLSQIYNNKRDPGKLILDHLDIIQNKITVVIYVPKRRWR